MSSKYVRDEFRASWPVRVPSIPLYETINTDPDHDTMPESWSTVEFVAYNEEPASLGTPSCRRETGIITVVLSTRSGTWDTILNDMAETVRNAYRHWEVSNLRVTQVDPPLATDGFSDGMEYIMDIDIAYTYDQFI